MTLAMMKVVECCGLFETDKNEKRQAPYPPTLVCQESELLDPHIYRGMRDNCAVSPPPTYMYLDAPCVVLTCKAKSNLTLA
jgi:hypothetical protein